MGLIVILIICLAAGAVRPVSEAGAADYWTPERVAGSPGPAVYSYDPSLELEMDYDPLVAFAKAADFISTLQVLDPGDDYGGIMEGESDWLQDIVQTDNTSESVWVWSRYRELTGDDRYDEYTARSWEYILNHPAYEEEGWESEGGKYYRVYNCGWAVRCESMYREATGDDTYLSYGKDCANFFLDNPVNLDYSLNNGYCTAWAVGNVYEYAEDIGDAVMRDRALARAVEVKAWAEADPDSTIGMHSWAMAGGATVRGLDRSYFKAYPEERAEWMATYAPYMPDTVDTPAAWDNAWKAWFAWGFWTAYEAGADDPYWDKFEYLADFLVAQDADDDGGIPANDDDPVTEDQTWVTSYLAMMCVDSIILADIGVDLASFEAEAASPGTVAVTWITSAETGLAGFNLYRSAGAAPRVRLNGGLITGRSPYRYLDDGVEPGVTYEYWLEAVDHSGAAETYGPAQVTVPRAEYAIGLAAYPNPCAGSAEFVFTLPEAGDVNLAIYDLAGRRVATIYDGPANAGETVIDADPGLAPGVYVCEMRAREYSVRKKLVVLNTR